MEDRLLGIADADPVTPVFASCSEALMRRVAAAAPSLADRGFRPTLQRIRAALCGGSPNDPAPALKRWREFGSAVAMNLAGSAALPRLPF